MRLLLTGLVLALLAFDGVASDVVAKLGTQLISRDEIERDVDAQVDIGEVLRQRVAGPAIKAYLVEHQSSWKLDDRELDEAIAAYRHAWSCSASEPIPQTPERERWIVEMLVSGAAAQRFIYDHFGGGRILFQQAGLEAFDANYQLLLDLERRNRFQVLDPVMRSQMYAYWEDDASHLFVPDAGREALDPAKMFSRCDQDEDTDATRSE